MTKDAPTPGLIDGALYVPADPNVQYQWHLNNINVTSVWPDYTGAGVSVMIIDDGFDLTHGDLAGNFNLAADHDFRDNDDTPLQEQGDNHGTAVTGVIGMIDNDIGGVGVAYEATLVGMRIAFSAQGTAQMFANAMSRAADFDISNNSWGYSTAFADNFSAQDYLAMGAALLNAAENGRGGLGTNTVFAAGNYHLINDNTNYHNLQNSAFAITVGAYDESGAVLSYSSRGANVLVSAPGKNIVTTDGEGNLGYANTNYVYGEGTSFATPVVSGVIALMLEANSELGYRDVQNILVHSAHKIGPANLWTENGAGLHYSTAYGFGAVDAHAAVRLAETWDAQSTYANRETISLGVAGHLPIPDNNGRLSDTITITQDLVLEHVEVKLHIDYANASHLEIALISPDGTRSILADNPSFYTAMPVYTFSTVQNWGENARGTWTLEVADIVTGTVGWLEDWELILHGSEPTNNNVFIYTDAFIGLINPVDTDGGIDTYNLAARTNNISMVLSADLENIYTGDGQDDVTGNDAANIIKTGRGDDRITQTLGADVIDGGAGIDTYFSHNPFNHIVTVNAPNDFTLLDIQTQTSTRISNVEIFNFVGIIYDANDLVLASQTDPVEVIYAVHGAQGIEIRSSEDNGFTAYDATELDIGGTGIVLLEEREFAHLTLTNNAGSDFHAVSMRMDDGIALTLRGFNEVNVVADGANTTSIEIGGGQRGFIQTGAGDDTVSFLAFLIDANADAQDRTLTASTFGGNDTIEIEDRSHYLVYDIDMGEGDDRFFAQGSLGGTITGGAGADTFAFGLDNASTVIEDFSVNDHLDVSLLLEHHSPNDVLANFITLTSESGNTHVSVEGRQIATLNNIQLTDPVQSYIDNGVLIVD